MRGRRPQALAIVPEDDQPLRRPARSPLLPGPSRPDRPGHRQRGTGAPITGETAA
jgi:hypothetical protein